MSLTVAHFRIVSPVLSLQSRNGGGLVIHLYQALQVEAARELPALC